MSVDLHTSGRRLRWLREDRKLTQLALALAVQTSQSAIAHYEADRKIPGRVTQAAIADVLEVHRSFFLWDEPAAVAA